MLLHQVIEFAAGTSPDVDALVAGDRRWTFSELERDVARMGTTLAHVVARDERIAWFSDNRPELVMALYAVPRAGALLVLGNIRHTAAEQAAMLKASPASVVIGANFETLDAFRFTFLVAIFLSSVPEAIGSTLGMRQAGFGTRRIFTLWSLLVLAATLAGGLSSAFLAEASPVLLTVIGAIAGGGILAMVSSVMMPEAYEDGGPAVGLATIAGFLVAFLFAFV